ncbi:MAG: hypothetical protein A2X99_05590 [Deltaproteobacteria bacterium GWB2_55_19]|nr:MAG: hypothetical protein A2X99_05590 [Deltaproteobacteria bacterium GWB2_55_19]
MGQWIKTKKTGIRYRTHATRKHGMAFDKYFVMTYKLDGKTKTEACGWASQGWTEGKAALLWAELAENRRRGEGPRTLAEKRAIAEGDRQERAEQAEQEAKDRHTFKEYALGAYKQSRDAKVWIREEQVIRLWLEPVLGALSLKSVAPFHFEKVKANMTKAGRALHTVRYVQGVARQVFNHAMEDGFFSGRNPARIVKKGKGKIKLPDNKRLRFLTREQADALLAELNTKSLDVRDMALVSLHTGCRASEVFSLTWADVDTDKGLLTLKDTKSGKNRAAFMTEAVKEVFRSKERGAPSELVFQTKSGEKIKQISLTFARAVDSLKLNEGIKDRRQRVVFHTLRHTYASWHVENGTDLYVVKELLGHSDISMTQRYSHLSESGLQAAVKRLESTLPAPSKVIEMVVKKG